jgi:hypothetical protein
MICMTDRQPCNKDCASPKALCDRPPLHANCPKHVISRVTVVYDEIRTFVNVTLKVATVILGNNEFFFYQAITRAVNWAPRPLLLPGLDMLLFESL